MRNYTEISENAQRVNARDTLNFAEEIRVDYISRAGSFYPALNPSSAVLKDGQTVITWQSEGRDGDGWGIFAQRFDAEGHKVGNDFLVNSVTDGDQEAPAITALSDGGFLIAWQSAELYDNYIYAQQFDDAGFIVKPIFQLDVPHTSSTYHPALTSLEDGGFMAVWESGSSKIMGQAFDASSEPIDSGFEVSAMSAERMSEPSVAVLMNGDIMATFHANTGSDTGIYAQRLDAFGNQLDSTFLVHAAGPAQGNRMLDASITALTDGGYAIASRSIVYGQEGSSYYNIQGAIFDGDDQKIGEDFNIGGISEITKGMPVVSYRNDGGFAVAWSQVPDTYLQQFDASGNKVGSELTVNKVTDTGADFVSIDTLHEGDLVMAWSGITPAALGLFAKKVKDDYTDDDDASGASTIYDMGVAAIATVGLNLVYNMIPDGFDFA